MDQIHYLHPFDELLSFTTERRTGSESRHPTPQTDRRRDRREERDEGWRATAPDAVGAQPPAARHRAEARDAALPAPQQEDGPDAGRRAAAQFGPAGD